VVACYLPQFHPVPENDAWWGRGFTEWTNVVRARPLFEGHYQPHLPADLGFCDLRLPEVRAQQAHLASRHGIDAFLYYHYWFGGRRVLDRPFEEVRRSGHPSLPFALCWANENWTRAWDAGDHEILLEQRYDPEERAAHLQYLVDAFADERYLRIDGRPLFAIYRIGALPEADGFVVALRKAAVTAGVGDPWVVKLDTHGSFDDPALTGCDAAAQLFPPHGIVEMGLDDVRLPVGHPGNRVLPYDGMVEAVLAQPRPAWTRYECVVPGWDNTPRRGDGRSMVVHDSTPEAYERWLRAALERAPERTPGRPLVLVNAWNEWAEGAHLEPDLRWGDAYLRATARATLGSEPEPAPAPEPPSQPQPPTASFEDLYLDLYDRYVELQQRLTSVEMAAQRRHDRTVGPLEAQLREQHELATRLAEQLRRRLDLD
jgi:hypothetical protein